MRDEAFAFGGREREAFVVVIGELAIKAQRVLRRRQQACRLRGNRHARRIVQMHHAERVGTRGVHGGMQCEAGCIDRMVARPDDVSCDIDLHEIRRADFVEREAERIDQEMPRLAGHACRNMRVDQVVPAIERREAIGGGQVDAGLLFRRRRVGPASAMRPAGVCVNDMVGLLSMGRCVVGGCGTSRRKANARRVGSVAHGAHARAIARSTSRGRRARSSPASRSKRRRACSATEISDTAEHRAAPQSASAMAVNAPLNPNRPASNEFV